MYQGERFNGFTHLAGAALAAAGCVALVVSAGSGGDPWKIVGFAIFGAMLVVLYTVSTLYHSLRGRPKSVLRKLDHCAIYLLIAGTYTPFTLVSLRGAWGWALFGTVWALALLGILQELWLARGARWLSLALYVSMGWLGLVAVAPLLRALGPEGFAWLAGGGAIYTLGVVFYLYDEQWRHAHGIWHLFVMGGSAAHFVAVYVFIG